MAEVPVHKVRPNPNQPRHRFDDGALEELASSIRRHGVLQPLLVSEDGGDGYLLVAGERRWRAAKLAGLRTVPAVIRERLGDADQLEFALVENLQRQDLTPLEEARAYEQLRTNLGLSQAEIAERVGMNRSTVANSLRLLKLSDDIQLLVENNELSAGHARTLLAFANEDERRAWARRTVETGLSVRDLERAARPPLEEADPNTTKQRQTPPKIGATRIWPLPRSVCRCISAHRSRSGHVGGEARSSFRVPTTRR